MEGGRVKNVELSDSGSFSRKNEAGVRWGVKLRDVAESGLLPTPSAMDHRTDVRLNNEHSEAARKGGCANLREKIHFLNTPSAMDSLPPRNLKALERQYTNHRKGRTTHSTLREQVVFPDPKIMFPTPTLGGIDDTNERALKKGQLHAVVNHKLASSSDTQFLNPQFVEEMMGFPIGWTIAA
ncbi:MAG: hypothetical protein MUF77_12870 [Leptospira sp.]|nr:hypothetical protein [Leptospira sp.]